MKPSRSDATSPHGASLADARRAGASTAAVLRRKVRSWCEKPWGVKLLIAPAFVLLGASRATLLTVPFRHIAPLLGHRSHAGLAVPLADRRQAARARAVGRAVATAARNTPWRSTCLAQAMAARALLGAGGVPYGLYLGVQREPDSAMAAHAWVCAGPVAVTGGRSFGRYTVVAAFLSPAPDPDGAVSAAAPDRAGGAPVPVPAVRWRDV